MSSRIYPTLYCSECGEQVRMIAVCEKPEEQTETRFYECSNPACRDSFTACVPNLRSEGWIGLWQDLKRLGTGSH